MPTIRLEMLIDADIKLVFDLARSIDLHQLSTQQTDEKPIAGRLSGLINLNETVTWQARHLGFKQKLTARITAFEKPIYFVDEMVKGAFKSFRHEHLFEAKGEGTLMTDIFTFQSPLGLLGKLADSLFLYNYMKKFLMLRNEVIKSYAENGQGRVLIAANEQDH